MGGICFTAKVARSELEERVIKMLQQRRIETDGKRPSWEAIVLKFPKIDGHFRKVEKVLEKYDDNNNNRFELSEIKSLMTDLGVEDSQEIRSLFQSSKDANNDYLTLSQVHVCLAIGYVLNIFVNLKKCGEEKEELERRPSQDLDLHMAYDIAVNAFLEFDKDGSGEVDHDEIAKKFRSKGHKHRSGITRMQSLATKRMEQLDQDKNGVITFAEFLTGFQKWIRTEDGDDLDTDADTGVSY